MAKKNSTKTATKEALQAAEPRVQVFSGWQGVNFQESPLGWLPLEKRSQTSVEPHRTTDLKPNFLMVQNNLETSESLTIETRPDSYVAASIADEDVPGYEDWRLTGVECLFHRWLFVVIRRIVSDDPDTIEERVIWKNCDENADDTSWHELHLSIPVTFRPPQHNLDEVKHIIDPTNCVIKEIGYFENNLVVTTQYLDPEDTSKYRGIVFLADLGYTVTPDILTDNASFTYMDESINPGNTYSVRTDDWEHPENPPSFHNHLLCAAKVPDPTTAATVEQVGEGTLSDIPFVVKTNWDEPTLQYTSRIEFSYCYTNRFGFTSGKKNIVTAYASLPPEVWSAGMCCAVSGNIPNSLPDGLEITGVDLFVNVDNYQTQVFAGHFDFKNANGDPRPAQRNETWKIIWTGGAIDVASWTNAPMDIPEENTTQGPPCSHFKIHDSRIYWWGDPNMPERLYIGGNPGNDFSVARSVGGGWIDIEPGTGIVINNTEKWKTAGGSNIVTMMCGNKNTTQIKRFNLVETNMVTTNEISSSSWMYEEVSNVVGCNSRYGSGVFADGLYAVSRYGIVLTTMAMEYNNQMRTQKISDAIEPIFTDRIAKALDDCRMVCIDNVLYLVLSRPDADDVLPNLDQVILCYDLDLKAWYTFTCDNDLYQHPGIGESEKIHHVFAFDSQDLREGLGIITDKRVIVYPTTGGQEINPPGFTVLIETGEIEGRQPIQNSLYLCQLELRFDYYIGDLDVFVEGVDYYGRPFVVRKHCSSDYVREHTEWIRIDKMVESYRIRVIGKARFRLTNINAKAYIVGNKVGLVYGYDAHDSYHGHRGQRVENHHYIKDYNNLRDALVP